MLISLQAKVAGMASIADLMESAAAQLAELAQEAKSSNATNPYLQGAIISVDIPATVDRLRVLLVAQWRQEGASWPAIGKALGTSHQAAQQRYKEAVRDVMAEVLDD